MDEKFYILYNLAVKEASRNRRIALYNQNATLAQLQSFENKYFLALVGYGLGMWGDLDEKRKDAT